MNSDLRQRIIQYMEKCRICTIATAGAECQPGISTVFFRNAGVNIYFNTGKETQKVKDILNNPRVAIALQTEGPVPTADRDITGIQYMGKASILSDKDMAEVPQAVIARHKAFDSSKLGKSVIIKVTPTKIYLIDYSQGFRHRESLEF